MIYGIDSYSNVRVSTKDQNEARQMIAMIIMLVGSRFFLPAVLCPLCPIPFVHRDKLRTELKPLTAEKRNLDVTIIVPSCLTICQWQKGLLLLFCSRRHKNDDQSIYVHFFNASKGFREHSVQVMSFFLCQNPPTRGKSNQ